MKFCSNPFNTLHVHPATYITCCSAWFSSPQDQHVHSANLDMWTIWNHPTFQQLRKKWLAGNSSLCGPCPLQLVDTNMQRSPTFKPVMETGPTFIQFANDPTCNLHCWTCRSKPIIEKQQRRVYNQTYAVLNTFKSSIKYISAIGSGDPFASPAWLEILQTMDIRNFPDIQIELFTNGLLLPKYWDTLSHLHDHVHTIKMSVDAATPEVYRRTRLGGTFEQLETALAFISKLNKNLTLNMVVQSDNFTDIPEFIRRAVRYNATKVNLTLMRPWGQMRGGQAAFDAHNLADPTHPKFTEFERLLQENNDLLNLPQVDASKLSAQGRALIHLN